jgi:hypothetical protein
LDSPVASQQAHIDLVNFPQVTKDCNMKAVLVAGAATVRGFVVPSAPLKRTASLPDSNGMSAAADLAIGKRGLRPDFYRCDIHCVIPATRATKNGARFLSKLQQTYFNSNLKTIAAAAIFRPYIFIAC